MKDFLKGAWYLILGMVLALALGICLLIVFSEPPNPQPNEKVYFSSSELKIK